MSWDLRARAPVCQVISPGFHPKLGMKGLYVGKGTLPICQAKTLLHIQSETISGAYGVDVQATEQRFQGLELLL